MNRLVATLAVAVALTSCQTVKTWGGIGFDYLAGFTKPEQDGEPIFTIKYTHNIQPLP